MEPTHISICFPVETFVATAQEGHCQEQAVEHWKEPRPWSISVGSTERDCLQLLRILVGATATRYSCNAFERGYFGHLVRYWSAECIRNIPDVQGVGL